MCIFHIELKIIASVSDREKIIGSWQGKHVVTV